MIGLLVVLVTIGAASGQAPTGVIAGRVVDESGATLTSARVIIVNQATEQTRELTTSTDGLYAAAALPPGSYRVAVQAVGFKRMERLATVEAGTTTTVDLTLELGAVTQTVTVAAAAPLIRYDHHQIGGVVTREQIEHLPLNGRNFLELARLEPGVTNPVRASNNRTFVASLGSGLQTVPRVGFTRVTVDGASITLLHTIGATLQVSQDVVQEFQLSTVNFDLSTGATTNGAINIVTRSGGNIYRGSAFSFYRDHHLAAYPALGRDPSNPNPFFRRHQFGTAVGGPVRKDRWFFFASYERQDQRGVVSIRPGAPEFAPLGGIFPGPYHGNLFSARVDMRLSDKHHAFVRYTHDGNRSFATTNPNLLILPSGWSRAINRVDQSVVGVTSALSPKIVNDVRISSFALSAPERPADANDCPECFGLGAPRIVIQGVGLTFGQSRLLTIRGHRYEIIDSLMWQTGRHGLRFGVDWEHTASANSVIDRDPAQITLWAPSDVRQRNPTIPLPSAFTTLEDVLQLPLRSFQTAVGPGWVPQRNFEPDRITDLFRVFANDTWRFDPRLTVNVGLSWVVEPNALNHDLTKPALLVPILGPESLAAPRVQRANVSPAFGIAWVATRDRSTVIRGGAGRYFDPVASANSSNLSTERIELLPLGTGRLIVSGSNLTCEGRVLDFRQPTLFTGAQLLACLPGLRADLLGSLNPGNRDFSVRNLDLTKSGSNLSDPRNETPSAVHVNVGVQRELATGFVVSADVVWKRFVHTFINGIDYNRWNSAAGPVLPRCTEQQSDDVTARCSNGNLYFDTTIGRARYKGLLLRVEKRFSGRAQLLASYALASYVGSNGTGTATAEMSGGRVFGFNNDDRLENYGPLPTDLRHVLNVSGFAKLPWQLQVGFSVAAYSTPPFTAYVANFDFNGDGTTNDLLPGTRVNQFGRGLNNDDLARLVARYNQEVAGRPLCCNQGMPQPLTLPDDYSFGDPFFTQDVRLTRTFPLRRGSARVSISVEVFNLFNTANLIGFSGDAGSQDLFGQPSGLVSQAFGSGGPRAVQLAARVNF